MMLLCAAGCGGKEDDFLAALRTEEHSTFCVRPQMLGVDAFVGNDGKRYVSVAGEFSFTGASGAVQALDGLKAKGYVKKEATSLQRNWASTSDAFEITEKGAKYFVPDPFVDTSIEVCIGKKKATDIVEYVESEAGGPRAAEARFRYEVSFNDLVDDLGVKKALKEEVGREWPGEGSAFFVKSNKGWRLEHAAWQ